MLSLAELSGLLLWVHVALLALVALTLGRVRTALLEAQKQYREQQNKKGGGAGDEAVAEDEFPTSSTLDETAEKRVTKTSPPLDDWIPLTDEEIDVLKQMHRWFKLAQAKDSESPGFADMPHDVLMAFIRGYSYRPDWPQACFAFVHETVKWRVKPGPPVDLAIDGPPCALMMRPADDLPNRAQFEQFFQAGPIGKDKDGRPVLLDRSCQTPPDQIFAVFDEATVVRHLTFNRECQRACNTAIAKASGRRYYKSILVIDVVGLSLAHTSKRMVGMLGAVNGLLGIRYPESVKKVYIVNAPFVFSALWTLGKKILHPITVAKMEVCGSDYAGKFAADGLQLDGGALPDTVVGWTATIARLREEVGDDALLQRGYLPADDEEVMRKHGLLE